jgi:hypothetical protein
MLPPPFQNSREFRAAFGRGLEDMLVHPELGVFILVLANATFDPQIQRLLQGRLRERFAELSGQYRSRLHDGRPLRDAPDDVLVFLKLMAVGYEGLRATDFRQVGPWEVQFNQLRSFRPPRMSHAAVSALERPFDPQGFHFNKPFLQKEVLWEGVLAGRHSRLLYNKFPFAELHGLLVVEPAACRAQFLAEADHRYLWQLSEQLGAAMPGVGFGYNAYGAYASVNHQHFQMYVRATCAGQGGRYPIEEPGWRHNGGNEDYPLPVLRFEAPGPAWEALAELHARGRSYNLLYRPGVLYVVPRAMQGSYQHSPWTAGFAWSEAAGAFTTFNADDYAALDDTAIRAEFAKLAA